MLKGNLDLEDFGNVPNKTAASYSISKLLKQH